jgi:hypothetical protein
MMASARIYQGDTALEMLRRIAEAFSVVVTINKYAPHGEYSSFKALPGIYTD